MSVVNAMTFVCAGCRKMITYAPHQAGTEITCPRCGDKAVLPQAEGLPPPLQGQAKKKRRLASCLFLGCGGCLTTLILLGALLALGLFTATPLQLPAALQQLCAPLIARGFLPATAPAPAIFHGSDISVAVTRMAKECPTIYQAALKQSAATETPVFCVTVSIRNGGGAAVSYRTWRDLADESDVMRAAKLQDGEGNLLGMVSFGRGTWPLGTRPNAEIQTGETVTDLLLFEGATVPPGDFLLTLPGENVGRSGALRFRIPRELVQ